jgi:transposase
MKLALTQEERENIRQLHRSCSKRRFADKLKAILLLDDGFSCMDVGRMLLLDDDTIRRYRTDYLSVGVESLLTDNNKGSDPYLTVIQLKELENHLEENTYLDSKGIIVWIVEKFNITYTPSGVVSLLERMNFVYKKPVLVPCKADVDKQLAFVEDYKRWKENLEPKDQIYFMDGVHPQHNTIATYGWIKKGKTKHLKTNNGRQRTNINGAINLQSKQVLYIEDERINSQTMITLLELMLKEQKEGKVHIILDNARYYHAIIVKQFLIKNPRIVLHFMPPYSPNLNIIERLWKILKQEVVYNKFYLKFKHFREAVINFFKNELWMKEKFDKILTDNFQIIKPNFSASYLG